MVLTITSGTLLNYLIKQLIERQRPFNHLMRDHGYSFPSGILMQVRYFCFNIVNYFNSFNKTQSNRIIANTITIIIWIVCCVADYIFMRIILQM